MKKEYILYLFLFTCIFLFPFLLYSIIVVMPNSTWHGFGVDSSERIYVGKYDEIICYKDGETLSSFSIPKYKNYYFTVQDDDTICVCNTTDIDIYNLSGDLIDTHEESTTMYTTLQWKKSTQTPNGDTYRVKNILGFRTILKNEQKIVYQTPIHEFVLFLLTIISVIAVIGLSILMCILYIPRKI